MNTRVLETLVVKLVGDTSKFAAPFLGVISIVKDTTDHLGNVGGAISDLASRFIDFGGIAEKVISSISAKIALFGSLLTGLTSALSLKSVFQAGHYEQTVIAFDTLMGDAVESKKTLDRLLNFADITPFSDEAILSAGRSLVQFGERGDELMTTMEDLGNAAAGTSSDFGMIALIFNQVRGVGKLLTQDFRQLSTRGVLSLQDIAKHFKTTTDVAQGMLSAGKITFNDLKAILHSMSQEGGRFANLMQRQSESFLGLWETFKGYLLVVMREIGVALLPFVKPILTVSIQILKTIEAIPQWIKNIVGGFLAMGVVIGAAASAFAGLIAMIMPTLGLLVAFHARWRLVNMVIGFFTGSLITTVRGLGSANSYIRLLAGYLAEVLTLARNGALALVGWVARWARAAILIPGIGKAIRAIIWIAPLTAAAWAATQMAIIAGWEKIEGWLNSIWDVLVSIERYMTVAMGASMFAGISSGAAAFFLQMISGGKMMQTVIGLISGGFTAAASTIMALVVQVRTYGIAATFAAKATTAWAVAQGYLSAAWATFGPALAVMATMSVMRLFSSVGKLNEEIAYNNFLMEKNEERTRKFAKGMVEAIDAIPDHDVAAKARAIREAQVQLQKEISSLEGTLDSLEKEQKSWEGLGWASWAYDWLGAMMWQTTSSYEQLMDQIKSVNTQRKELTDALAEVNKRSEQFTEEGLSEKNAQKYMDLVDKMQQEAYELSLSNQKLTDEQKLIAQAIKDGVTGEGLEMIVAAYQKLKQQKDEERAKKMSEDFDKSQADRRIQAGDMFTSHMKGLKEQLATYGMNNRELDNYKLKQEAIKAGLEDMIPTLIKENNALHDRIDALRQNVYWQQKQYEWMQKGGQIYEQYLKPQEAYVKSLTELQALLNVGAITQETYDRALKGLNNQFETSTETVNGLSEAVKALYASFLDTSAVKRGTREFRQMMAETFLRGEVQKQAAELRKGPENFGRLMAGAQQFMGAAKEKGVFGLIGGAIGNASNRVAAAMNPKKPTNLMEPIANLFRDKDGNLSLDNVTGLLDRIAVAAEAAAEKDAIQVDPFDLEG